MVSANNVAELYLSWANEDGDLITNLKLQKLLFYAQAWHLVHFKKSLFDDTIEAWEFGPVVPNVYHKFKKFRYSAIKYKDTGEEKKCFSKDQRQYLLSAYDTFIKFSAHELVNMSHNEPPWINAMKSTDKIIIHKSMKDYYSTLLSSNG